MLGYLDPSSAKSLNPPGPSGDLRSTGSTWSTKKNIGPSGNHLELEKFSGVNLFPLEGSRGLRRVQESSGALRRAQESPGAPRKGQEGQGGLDGRLKIQKIMFSTSFEPTTYYCMNYTYRDYFTIVPTTHLIPGMTLT
jgi:hypothetical protein